MDLYVRDLLINIYEVFFLIIYYIIRLPFILINYIRIKKINYYMATIVNFIKNKNKSGFVGKVDNSSPIFRCHYKYTKKHSNYLNNVNLNNEQNEYSLKTLYKLIYFSNFFGTLFYYYSKFGLNTRLNNRYSYQLKRNNNNIFIKLDALDVLYILASHKTKINYELFLNSLFKFIEYKNNSFYWDIIQIINFYIKDDLEKINLLIITINSIKNDTDFKNFIDVDYLLETLNFNNINDKKIFLKLNALIDLIEYKKGDSKILNLLKIKEFLEIKLT